MLGSMEVSVLFERVGLLAKLAEQVGVDEHDKDVALAWINEMVSAFAENEVKGFSKE